MTVRQERTTYRKVDQKDREQGRRKDRAEEGNERTKEKNRQ